jgi:hypothetical protein
MSEERPDEKLDALLRHALSRAPTAEPPAGFAREMAILTADQPEAAAVEILATRALLGVSVMATGCALMFVELDAWRAFHLLDRAPWPLMLAAAAIIGAIKIAEIVQADAETR